MRTHEASDFRGNSRRVASKRKGTFHPRLSGIALTAYIVTMVMALPAVGTGISTLVVPGKALGPVSLGMSVKQVTAILGSPKKSQSGTLTFSHWAMIVDFRKGIAIRIGTFSSLFRTIQGAGVGVSHARATQLIGDQNEILRTTGTYITALYPFQGVGLVFRGGRAVEVFVQPTLIVDPSIARILPLAPPTESGQSTNKAALGGGSVEGGGSAAGSSRGGGTGASGSGGGSSAAGGAGSPGTGTPTGGAGGAPAGGGTPATGAPAGGDTPTTGAPAGGGTPATGTPAGGGTPATGTPAGGGTPATGAPVAVGAPAIINAGAPIVGFGTEMAVNPGAITVGIPLNNAKRLFEPGPVSSSGGAITDSFTPMVVHVYIAGP